MFLQLESEINSDIKEIIRRNINWHQLIGGKHTLKKKLYVKTSNSQNIQDIVHHVTQDWTLFVVNKFSKLKHFKVTGQKTPFKNIHNL